MTCSPRSRARTSSSRSWRATAGSPSRTRRSRPASHEVLDAGAAQLTADGYSARSAFLTSPTFGGVSWLAHATLQSGVWVDSQRKYDRLTRGGPVHPHPSVRRGRLAHGRGRPLQPRAVGRRHVVLRVGRHARRREHGLSRPGVQLCAHARPVHLAALPRARARRCARTGDGRDRPGLVAHAVDAPASPRAVVGGRRRQSVFAPAARRGPLAGGGVGRPGARAGRPTGSRCEYSLATMFSFLQTYDQPDLVLVVLGDHQPARIVSGPDGGSRRARHDHLEGPRGLRRDRLVGVGCRRPSVCGRAGVADGRVPRPLPRGLQRVNGRRRSVRVARHAATPASTPQNGQPGAGAANCAPRSGGTTRGNAGPDTANRAT